MRGAAWLSLWLASACAGRADEPPAQSARGAAAAPVPPPRSSGCVESEPLQQFVLALESHRQRAREAALAALGGQVQEYASVLDTSIPAPPVGQVYERNGQLYGVVAQLAVAAAPRVPLLRQGNLLHPLDERPRAHPVPLRVCGVNACPGAPPVLPPRSVVAVPLPSDLELGPALPLRYDFWWAQVSYDRKRSCPAPPATAAGLPGVVSSGAR